MRSFVLFTLTVAMLLLAGCDLFGSESADVTSARREAEGKAVGSACRHAMRAIEDCYTLNPKTMKAAVFAGWREMDEYMRENKIDGVAPVLPHALAAADGKSDAGKGDADKGHDKDKKKSSAKSSKNSETAAAKPAETTAKASEGGKTE